MEIITHLINNCDQEDSDIMAATKNLLHLSLNWKPNKRTSSGRDFISAEHINIDNILWYNINKEKSNNNVLKGKVI